MAISNAQVKRAEAAVRRQMESQARRWLAWMWASADAADRLAMQRRLVERWGVPSDLDVTGGDLARLPALFERMPDDLKAIGWIRRAMVG